MKRHKKGNRSDSRARTPCPQCGFRCHGERGLKMHIAQMHSEQPQPKPTGAA